MLQLRTKKKEEEKDSSLRQQLTQEFSQRSPDVSAKADVKYSGKGEGLRAECEGVKKKKKGTGPITNSF